MNCFTISDINGRQARKPGELAGAHGGLMDPSPDLKVYDKVSGEDNSTADLSLRNVV